MRVLLPVSFFLVTLAPACSSSRPLVSTPERTAPFDPTAIGLATTRGLRLDFMRADTPTIVQMSVDLPAAAVMLVPVRVTATSGHPHRVAVLTADEQVHLVDGQTGEVMTFLAPPASTWDIPRPLPERPGSHQEKGDVPWEWDPGECERLDGPSVLQVRAGEVALTRCIWGSDSKYFDCRDTDGEVRVVLHQEPHGVQPHDIPDLPTYPESGVSYQIIPAPDEPTEELECGRVECTATGNTYVFAGDSPEPGCTWGSTVVDVSRISRNLDRFMFYLASLHDGDRYDAIITQGCPARLERRFDPRDIRTSPGPFWAYPQDSLWYIENGQGSPTPVSAEHLVFTGAHPDR